MSIYNRTEASFVDHVVRPMYDEPESYVFHFIKQPYRIMTCIGSEQLDAFESYAVCQQWYRSIEEMQRYIRSYKQQTIDEQLLIYGDECYDMGDKNEAFCAYMKSYQQHHTPKAALNISLIYMEVGRYENGLEWAKKAHGLIQVEKSKKKAQKLELSYIKLYRFATGKWPYDMTPFIDEIMESPDDRCWEFLVWYYNQIHEEEHAAVSFMRMTCRTYRKRWMESFLMYMLAQGQGQRALKELGDLITLERIAFMQALAVASQKEVIGDIAGRWFLNQKERYPKESNLLLCISVYYIEKEQVIPAIHHFRQVEKEELDKSLHNMYAYQQAKIAAYGYETAYELNGYEMLYTQWKNTYRLLYDVMDGFEGQGR